ncbi:MAG TPA: response regulator transcription factor [Anaerolineales bacterium]|nr:response regulator transcription factor [Anaerolineales bacterium]
MNDPIRILVADDHPLFREGVVHSLSGKEDLQIIGQAETAEDALHLTRENLPDVVLLDIAMPERGGLAIAGEIAITCPATKIIMLTVSENEDDLLSAFKAGANGYVLKGVSARELIDIIRAVADGVAYVTPALATRLLVEMAHGKPYDPLMELTDREQEILQHVADGLTNRQIGERLHLAEKTIKHYMTNILGKLHVNNRLDAAMLLVRRSP